MNENDFEIIRIYNIGSPGVGQMYLTVSSNKVGIQNEILASLGNPETIIIRKGVRRSAGMLSIEAAYEGDEGAIAIDYSRKKVAFFNTTFVEMCKGLIAEYANGEIKVKASDAMPRVYKTGDVKIKAGSFSPGVFYCVKGVLEENRVVFDFRKANMRFVKTTHIRRDEVTGKVIDTPIGKEDTPAHRGRPAGSKKNIKVFAPIQANPEVPPLEGYELVGKK